MHGAYRGRSGGPRDQIVSRALKYERSLPQRWNESSCEAASPECSGAIDKCTSRTADYTDFCTLHQFVSSLSFESMHIIEIPLLVESLTEFLMSSIARTDPYSTMAVLRVIMNVWYLLPKSDDLNHIWLSFPLVEAVFDCLFSTDPVISLLSLKSLCNLAAISQRACTYLVEKEIFAFLTKFLIKYREYSYIATAISLMQTLVECGVTDDLYFQMRQSIDVFKYLLLRSPFPEVVKHAIRTLIPFLDNERGFEFARLADIGSELRRCVLSKRDTEFGYFAFRAISVFVEHGYTRVFMHESFFTSIPTFLVFHAETDISSILFTAAMLLEKNWEKMYEHSVHEHARRFLLEGSYENRIAAGVFLLEMIRVAHPQIKDQLANSDCFEGFCGLIECYTNSELCLFAKAMHILLDLNFVLYSQRLRESISKADLETVIESSSEETIKDLLALLEKRLEEPQCL